MKITEPILILELLYLFNIRVTHSGLKVCDFISHFFC